MTASTRPHGYVRFKVEQCHCDICRAGNTAYVARRHRLIAYGRWQPYIDAEPARSHVKALGAAGIGWKRVALLADVQPSTMSKLLYGSTRRGPSDRIRPTTAAAILAVEIDTAPLADGALMVAAGTQRRMRAMAALGWGLSEQGRQIGRAVSNYHKILDFDEVRVGTARAVADLYRQLSTVAAPAGYSATRARSWAHANHCFPPIAWDDDTINDPAARPCMLPAVIDSDPDVDDLRIQQFVAGFDITLTWREKTEVAHRMAERSAAEIGSLLGIKAKSATALRSQHWSRQRVAA